MPLPCNQVLIQNYRKTHRNPKFGSVRSAANVTLVTPDGSKYSLDYLSHLCFKKYTDTWYRQHNRYHTRLFKCPVESCPSSGFGEKTHLHRHMKGKHPECVQNNPRFYCTEPWCKYSREGTKGGMVRRDNYIRHMKSQHPNAEIGM